MSDVMMKPTNDRGAITLMVVALLGFGVLSGFLFLVIATGDSVTERGVQRGASEAAALAIAQRCAENPPGVTTQCADLTSRKDLASALANANSPDNFSDVLTNCRRTVEGGSVFNDCPALSGNLLTCKAVDVNSYPRFARVITTTRNSSGGPSFISRLANVAKEPISACSQAAWGPAGSVPVTFPVAVPAANLTESYLDRTVVIKVFDPTQPVACTSPSCPLIDTVDGLRMPSKLLSGFAFIETNDSTCIRRDNFLTIPDKPGELWVRISTSNPNSLCGGFSNFIGTSVFLPVMVDIRARSGGSGSGGIGDYEFRIVSFYRFKVLATKVKGVYAGPSSEQASLDLKCPTSSTSCIKGAFSRGVVGESKISKNPDYNLGVQALEILP